MNQSALIDECAQSAATIRRRLHEIPELGYQEFKTSALIRDELAKIGVDFVAGVEDAETATIAMIGDPSRRCVALRADIDALPIVEQTGLPYASRHDGRMHACGHDGHTATLLATARVLKQLELPVCVKLLFQPAEEGGGGGEVLTNAGVLDGRVGPKVDAIYGLHGWPGLPVGTVSTRAGALLAATDSFSLDFIGKGCHGAFPHLGSDPILAACEAVVNLQQFVSRELDPTEPAVVTVGKINSGTATNIIPDIATIAGTARSITSATREHIRESIERRCAGIATASRCESRLTWETGYPATINDPKHADVVARVARTNLGETNFIPAAGPVMGGEDFAYYLEKVPGCFFFIGVCPPGRSSYPSLHNDHFDFSDSAIPTGVRMFVELARQFAMSKP